MKLGVADYGMNVWDGGLYDIEVRLEELRSAGFAGTERLEAVSEADAIHKAARYRRLGMDFSTCRGPDVQSGIQWTSALGKDYVWLVPGDSTRNVDFDVFCRRSNKFSGICRRWGIRAGIHNHLGMRVESQQELEDFLKKCPECGIVFDTGHLSAAGGDPVEIVRKYSARICVLHLKDVFIKDSSVSLEKWPDRLRFCELGGGNNGLDNRKVMEALVKSGYDGWIHIEHDTHLNEPLSDLAKSCKYLADAGFFRKK